MDRNGVKLNVRALKAIALALLFTAVPTELGHEYVLVASQPWGWIDAVARVRFDAQRPIPPVDDNLTLHTAIVLGVFKRHPLLPLPVEPVALIERRGFMQSEDGLWPCWDNERPIPAGTEAIVYLHWHADLGGFWLASVRDRSLRMASSARECD
jgi:hypothetical protein